MGKFGKKVGLHFCFIWHGIQKISEKSRNRERRNIQMGVLCPKSNSKLIFKNFAFLWPVSNKKRQKTCFLRISTKSDFWSKSNITNVFLVKFPF